MHSEKIHGSGCNGWHVPLVTLPRLFCLTNMLITGSQCFCGTSLEIPGVVPVDPSMCGLACSGNSSLFCGDMNYMGVFSKSPELVSSISSSSLSEAIPTATPITTSIGRPTVGTMHKINSGAIIGGITGSVILLAIIAIAALLLHRRRHKMSTPSRAVRLQSMDSRITMPRMTYMRVCVF